MESRHNRRRLAGNVGCVGDDHTPNITCGLSVGRAG